MSYEIVPNWVNLDAVIEAILDHPNLEPVAAAIPWARAALTRELKNSGWKATADTLLLPYSALITPREAVLWGAGRALSGLDLRIAQPSMHVAHPWLRRALADGDLVLQLGIPENVHSLTHLMEALVAENCAGNLAITVEQAKVVAARWDAKLARRAELTEGSIVEIGTLLVNDQLCTLYQLMNKQATVREGAVMHHCIGSDFHDPSDTCHVYSLRDEERSRVTIKIVPGTPARVYQMSGLANAKVDEELRSRIRNLLAPRYDNELVDAPVLVLTAGIGALDGIRFIDARGNEIGWNQGAQVTRMPDPEMEKRIMDLVIERLKLNNPSIFPTNNI